jgi:RNA polymerase subunit RPABC4/transcription elongation factor Spt4
MDDETVRECPECGERLREDDPVCPKCGHEPDAAAVAQTTGPPAGGQPALLIGLAIGLVVGLVAGWFWGHASAPSAVREAASARSAPGPAAPGPAPEALRLRERGWRQGAGGLCTGLFEVVTAPPSVKSLSFSVMDSKGKVIGRDSVSSPGGIRPHTVLELGFDCGDCSRVKNWQVKVDR